MQPFRDWSFGRVLLVSSGWILMCVIAAVAYLLIQFRSVFMASSASAGSGAVGAVSFGLNLLTLLIPLLPPVALTAAWHIARRSRAA
ncbi:MAG TPA: hypothetical protein VGJ78_00790 [Vicinamibacterales bacterium]